MARGRAGRIPRIHKGKLLYDDIDGTWYGEREGKLFHQRGILVSRKNFDRITDSEREEAIQRRMT